MYLMMTPGVSNQSDMQAKRSKFENNRNNKWNILLQIRWKKISKRHTVRAWHSDSERNCLNMVNVCVCVYKMLLLFWFWIVVVVYGNKYTHILYNRVVNNFVCLLPCKECIKKQHTNTEWKKIIMHTVTGTHANKHTAKI